MRNNENTPTRSWRGVTRRLIVAGTSALMVASLMTPSAAFAAESISVEGTNYDWQDGGYSGTGSNGGTWSWDTAENLTLNNYDGGAISAKGDLTVTYSGTNTITNETKYGQSIFAEATAEENGDLNISADGDATLNLSADDPIYAYSGNIDIEGGTINIESNNDYGYGIDGNGDIMINDATVNVKSNSADGHANAISAVGSVTINNSKVKIEANGKFGATGIYSEDASEGCGGIVINSSTIDIVASSVKGGATGIDAGLSSKSPAGVAIKDSTVNIKATGFYGAAGIYVSNDDGEAYINVNNSDVSAKAEGTSNKAELLAALYAESDYGASITVDGAEIKTPEGGEAYTFEEDGAKVASIGAKGASGKDDMASEVVIESTKKDEAEPEAEVTPASYTKAGEKKLAQTGDASAAGMFAAAAAGVTALGAGAFLSRRRS